MRSANPSRAFLNHTFALHTSASSGAWRARRAKIDREFHHLTLFAELVVRRLYDETRTIRAKSFRVFMSSLSGRRFSQLHYRMGARTASSFFTAKKSAAGLGSFGSSGVGDFNQDGNQDLAVAGLSSNHVSVLLGNGDGTFQTAVNFPVTGTPSFADSIIVSYFNGDSIQDLAVANSNGNNISVLLGNGNGTFRAALNSSAGAPSIHRLWRLQQ